MVVIIKGKNKKIKIGGGEKVVCRLVKRVKGKWKRALPKGNMMMIFVCEDYAKSSEKI